MGIIESFSHVSTGGGAMLALLAGDKLPGIEALK
jgi:phosphoglycerate kinase